MAAPNRLSFRNDSLFGVANQFVIPAEAVRRPERESRNKKTGPEAGLMLTF
jgi:hypothetical protein